MTTLMKSAVARVPVFTNQLKEEGVSFREDIKQKGIALAGEASGMEAMSRLAQAARAALEAVGPPSVFNPLARFMAHLEVKYGGFRHNQM